MNNSLTYIGKTELLNQHSQRHPVGSFKISSVQHSQKIELSKFRNGRILKVPSCSFIALGNTKMEGKLVILFGII